MQITGIATARRAYDDARGVFLHFVDDNGSHAAYQYVNMPEATEEILLALAESEPEQATKLWFNEIQGQYEETQISCREFGILQLITRLQS